METMEKRRLEKRCQRIRQVSPGIKVFCGGVRTLLRHERLMVIVCSACDM